MKPLSESITEVLPSIRIMPDQGELGLPVHNGKQHSFVSFSYDGINLPISDPSLFLYNFWAMFDFPSSGDLYGE